MLTVRDFKQSVEPGVSSRPGWRSMAPLIAWSLLIFFLSSVPGNKYPQVNWNLADKAVHFSLYSVLGCFAALCFVLRGRSFWVPIAFGVAYGLSDELHQVFVPLRSPSILDWCADSVGTIAGVAGFQLLSIYLNRSYISNKDSTHDTAESMELT